jgi:hypothetical protein
MKRAFSILSLLGLLPGSAAATTPAFEAQTIDPAIQIGYGVAIGDGDGDEDILVADKRDFLWYENPSWEKRVFHTFHLGDQRETLRDNVCLAARDINGDGKVEVAVGTNWNPAETTSTEGSGGVWFLGSLGNIKPVRLPHEPTTHRMYWSKSAPGKFSLVVIPLHGVGNVDGRGPTGSRIFSFAAPDDLTSSAWPGTLLDDTMHKTHNGDILSRNPNEPEQVIVAGVEGVSHFLGDDQGWSKVIPQLLGMRDGPGEIRYGQPSENRLQPLIATIEPMHGNTVAAYTIPPGSLDWERNILDTDLAQGHALAVADLLHLGRLQIVAGWRNPNANGKVGIKLYIPDANGKWTTTHLIDDNTMACEDLKIADLNKDGKPDIIATGRATQNVVIYWNKSE